MQRVEAVIERILWNSRWMVMIAVVASLVVALEAFVMATVDVWGVFRYLTSYIAQADTEAGSTVRTQLITAIVKAIDGYLIAAIMVIFAFGLYELFISRINIAQRSETAARLLQIRSIDDLKDRLAKIVLLVLIVEYFQYALQTPFTTALDLLYFALGILLIGGAIYLTKDKGTPKPTTAAGRRMRVVAQTQRTSAVDGDGDGAGDGAGDDRASAHLR